MLPADKHKNKLTFQNSNIKILMYHRITRNEDVSKMHWTYISAEQFRKQLLLLDHFGFTPITFKDYRLFTKGELNLPRKPIILTFDDGYEDVYKIAFPILKEYGMKAVLFVLGNRSIKTDLWNIGDGTISSLLMNDEQIIDLYEAGFEIGSHTMTHAKLPEISSQNAWEEISGSKLVIESILNSPIRSFSYPYGETNTSVKRLVIRAGYNFACGVFTGPPHFGNDLYDFRRITISNSTSALNFATKILTPFEYYEWFGVKTVRAFHDFSDELRIHEN